MAKFQKELSKLKELLMASDNFSEINHYFYDHLAENPAFLKSCKKAKNPVLKAVLKKIGERVFKEEEVRVTGIMFMRPQRTPFYHGAFQVNGRFSSVFFFKDIDMGLAAISVSMGSSEIKYVRFSCMAVKQDKDTPLFIHPTSKTIH